MGRISMHSLNANYKSDTLLLYSTIVTEKQGGGGDKVREVELQAKGSVSA